MCAIFQVELSPAKLMMLLYAGMVVGFVLCNMIISAFKYETMIQNHVTFQSISDET